MSEVKRLIENVVTGYCVVSDVALITLDKIPNDIRTVSEIFSSIAKQDINVDMIAQSPSYSGVVNISFSIPSKDLSKAISTLAKFKKDIPQLRLDIDSNNTKISVFGEGMRNLPGVAANLFTLLASNDIDIKLVTTSEIDISYLVSGKDEQKAIEAIRKEFNL